MNAQERYVLSCAAGLLRYPDASLLHNVYTLNSEGQALGQGIPTHDGPAVKSATLPQGIKTFLSYAGDKDMLDLQGMYVASFDLDSSASLYLSGHVFGDGPRQGPALAALHAIYGDAGFEALPGEMPDFLPLVLEFLAVGPEWACTVLCGVFAPAVHRISRQLDAKGSPYADLVRCTCDLLMAQIPKTEN